MTTAPRYVVTVQEVEAEPLSVSQRTVEKVTGIAPAHFLELVRAGALPAAHLGHDRIVFLSDLRAWLEKEIAAPKAKRKPPVRKVAGAPAPAPSGKVSMDELMARGGARKKAG